MRRVTVDEVLKAMIEIHYFLVAFPEMIPVARQFLWAAEEEAERTRKAAESLAAGPSKAE